MPCTPYLIDTPATARRGIRSHPFDTSFEGRTSIRLGEPPTPQEPPRPKRGAFPPRKSDLERAEPFEPDHDEGADRPRVEPERPSEREPPKRSNDAGS